MLNCGTTRSYYSITLGKTNVLVCIVTERTKVKSVKRTVQTDHSANQEGACQSQCRSFLTPTTNTRARPRSNLECWDRDWAAGWGLIPSDRVRVFLEFVVLGYAICFYTWESYGLLSYIFATKMCTFKIYCHLKAMLNFFYTELLKLFYIMDQTVRILSGM